MMCLKKSVLPLSSRSDCISTDLMNDVGVSFILVIVSAYVFLICVFDLSSHLVISCITKDNDGSG